MTLVQSSRQALSRLCFFQQRLISPALLASMPAGCRTSATSCASEPQQGNQAKRLRLGHMAKSEQATKSPSPGYLGPKIVLTEEEEKVRQLLVDVAGYIDKHHPPTDVSIAHKDEPLTLRFTGGWVRDKLLQGKSNDIDVGINKMTGYEFGLRLAEFLEENSDKYGIPARNIHKIESNPDKSKHLETAATKIMDLDIDLVNLRSEAYSGDSRIPQMEFGTPLQDALRRDACVNALFYNIHTKEVEDFTGKGLEDMGLKLIRTPLPPFQTFHDDPLRVLRLIRFASRLGFRIVEEVEEAMRNPEIRLALQSKISRERVGMEIEKMLKGKNPFEALRLIDENLLFDCIFIPTSIQRHPEEFHDIPSHNVKNAILALKWVLETDNPNLAALHETFSADSQKYMAWSIAALIPWANSIALDEKKRPVAAAVAAAREGLKMSNKGLDVLKAAFANLSDTQETVKKNAIERLSRADAGMKIREWGNHWHSRIHCALLLELLSVWPKESMTPSDDAMKVMKNYNTFLQIVEQHGVGNAYSLKPILDGEQLRAVLSKDKPGPWLKVALDALIKWQLGNPEGTVEDAKAFAKRNIIPS